MNAIRSATFRRRELLKAFAAAGVLTASGAQV